MALAISSPSAQRDEREDADAVVAHSRPSNGGGLSHGLPAADIRFFIRYVSDVPDLREATLRANVLAIAQVLNRGQDPSQIDIYTGWQQL